MSLTYKDNINKIKFLIIHSGNHPSNNRLIDNLYNILIEYGKVYSTNIQSKGILSYIKEILSVYNIIIFKKIDILITIEPFYGLFFVKLWKKIFKLNLLYYSGNVNYDIFTKFGYNKLLCFIFKKIEINHIKCADTIITCNYSMKTFFLERSKINRVFAIPEYIPFPFDYNNFEHPSFIKKGFLNIVYIAVIHSEYVCGNKFPRGWELIYACKNLVEMGITNIFFTVIGSGDGLDYLKTLIHKYKLEDYFEIVGFVDDQTKWEILRFMDIGFSEDYESYITHKYNLSSKIQEYIVNKIPVITGTQGDKGLIINNETTKCGICIKPLNENDLNDCSRYINDISSTIEHLLNNKNELDNYKLNMETIRNTIFSKENIFKQYREVVEEMVENKSKSILN